MTDTYPPEHHTLATSASRPSGSTTRVHWSAPHQAARSAADGSVHVGALGMLVDVAAAAVAVVAASAAGAPPRTSRTGRARSCTARSSATLARSRAGNAVTVVGVDVYDGAGRDELPSTCGARTVVVRPASRRARPASPAASTSRRAHAAPAPWPATPTGSPRRCSDLLGLRVVDDAAGVVECPRATTSATASAPSTAASCTRWPKRAERAAHARRAACGPRTRPPGHSSAQTKVGPDARAPVAARQHRARGVELRIVDAGNADTVLCLATVSLGA